MYKAILLPVDGSPTSESAVPAAVSLARQTGARLHIVHVQVAAATWAAVPGLPPAASAETDAAARAYLDELTERVSTELGESVSFELLDPPPAAAIVGYARRASIDMIVMATHGRRGLSRAWLGSVAAGVIREAPVPVLLIRPKRRMPRTLRIRHVLVPLDGSETAEAVLPHAIRLARASGARVTAFSVVEPVFRLGEAVLVPSVALDPESYSRRVRAARDYLARIVDRLKDEGVEAAPYVVSGEAVDAITQFAESADVDLIALATHGRSGWQRFAFGSVADKVVRTGARPVLVVKPQRAADAARGG
jgi:nucleotide-binding universal stress UspA family protein